MRHSALLKENLTEKEKSSINILEILRRRGPLSRADISQGSGVDAAAISDYVEGFLKDGLVEEKELSVSRGGKKAMLLDLRPEGGYVIGVGLNLANMVGVLADLKGNILARTQISRPKTGVKEISQCLLAVIRDTLKSSKKYSAKIKGIGVGIAGLINKKDGSIRWPQKVGGSFTYASVDVPLRNLIEAEFDLPALIENDATAACFGEYWADTSDKLKNIIYMFSGVGCGIMINGEIYTGTHGYAGEVAIRNYKEEGSFNCRAGRSCFLKPWDMDLGVAEDVKGLLAQDDKAAAEFFKLTSTDFTSVDLKSVFSAARAKNVLALSVLDVAAKRLGIKIAYLVNLLNPQAVIIGGGLEEAGDGFLNKARATVKDWAFRETTEDLKILYSQLKENAVACGAADLVTSRVFAEMI